VVPVRLNKLLVLVLVTATMPTLLKPWNFPIMLSISLFATKIVF
jgi:hypothetical protein